MHMNSLGMFSISVELVMCKICYSSKLVYYLFAKLNRYVIDTMQSICLREAGVSASGSFEEETTLVGLMFGGYLRSKVTAGF